MDGEVRTQHVLFTNSKGEVLKIHMDGSVELTQMNEDGVLQEPQHFTEQEFIEAGHSFNAINIMSRFDGDITFVDPVLYSSERMLEFINTWKDGHNLDTALLLNKDSIELLFEFFARTSKTKFTDALQKLPIHSDNKIMTIMDSLGQEINQFFYEEYNDMKIITDSAEINKLLPIDAEIRGELIIGVVDSNGELIAYLDTGNKKIGWSHIYRKHITCERANEYRPKEITYNEFSVFGGISFVDAFILHWAFKTIQEGKKFDTYKDINPKEDLFSQSPQIHTNLYAYDVNNKEYLLVVYIDDNHHIDTIYPMRKDLFEDYKNAKLIK